MARMSAWEQEPASSNPTKHGQLTVVHSMVNMPVVGELAGGTCKLEPRNQRSAGGGTAGVGGGADCTDSQKVPRDRQLAGRYWPGVRPAAASPRCWRSSGPCTCPARRPAAPAPRRRRAGGGGRAACLHRGWQRRVTKPAGRAGFREGRKLGGQPLEPSSSCLHPALSSPPAPGKAPLKSCWRKEAGPRLDRGFEAVYIHCHSRALRAVAGPGACCVHYSIIPLAISQPAQVLRQQKMSFHQHTQREGRVCVHHLARPLPAPCHSYGCEQPLLMTRWPRGVTHTGGCFTQISQKQRRWYRH